MIEKWPKPRLFRIKNSLERYGFAHILAERVGISSPMRSFSVTWQHGLYEHSDETGIDVYLASKEASLRQSLVLVGSSLDRDFLVRHGHKNVIAAGLPFAYTSKSSHSRNRILLAFPGHSAESKHEKIPLMQQDSYLDFLDMFKNYFDEIWVSSYGLDEDQDFYRQARSRGFRVVQGAHPSDSNSLRRTRAMLDAASHVTTNTIGSHFFYALTAGCAVSVCGPLCGYRKTENSAVCLESFSQSELMAAYSYGSQFSGIDFGKFFVESPCEGRSDVDLGRFAIGADNVILDNDVLRSILRWTWSLQLKGYASGALRRMKRSVSRSYYFS